MTLHERTTGTPVERLALAARLLRDPSAIGLALLNLAAGALVLNHPPYASNLLTLYWVDCVLIGLFGILKLFFIPVKIGPEEEQNSWIAWVLRFLARLFVAAAFAFVYGFILLCVTALIGGLAGEEARIRGWTEAGVAQKPEALGFAIMALFAAHLLSFVWNTLVRHEYKNRTFQDQMSSSTGRLLFLFLVLAVGGIAVSLFRAPVLLVVIFVLVKTASDLAAHAWDHKK